MIGFLLFFGLIMLGGYLLARNNARSTPAKKMMFDAGKIWNRSSPAQRAVILAHAGIVEGYPNFSVYLVSNWAQLDLKLARLLAAVVETTKTGPIL